MNDLFGETAAPEAKPARSPDEQAFRPLADRLRPSSLDQVIGQDRVLGPDGPLGRMLAAGRLGSCILWGPPGCGKTTIARLLADAMGLSFEPVSAVFSGVADLRKVFDRARQRQQGGHQTLLFVDEIHRFNRAQQDAFLPVVEDGTVVLLGATTENPSFALNAALLSRCQVLVLTRLDDAAIETLLDRAETAAGKALPVTAEARTALRAMADGDGRFALTLAETLFAAAPDEPLDTASLASLLQRRAPVYDKDRDGHFNLISALHKSVRGSDPDAALYWLARMLAAGEDPHYLARRMTRMAIEDIGLAQPNSLAYCLSAWQCYERLGSPEGELALAEAVISLALAPKSNAAYGAYKAAMRSARETGSLAPPKHILNAPTALMKELGHGADYHYDHDAPDAFSGQHYFPEGMDRQSFYNPTDRGQEATLKDRLARFAALREQRQGGDA